MMQYIQIYFQELISLANEMSPYLLFGFLFAGLLKVYFPQRLLTKYMGGSTASASFFSSMLGVPMPLCSCGVLPTGISLFNNGASRGSTTSFLISTPQTGIDSMLVTYSMLGLPFAIIRPIAALFTGFVGGVLTNKIVKAENPSYDSVAESIGKNEQRSIKYMLRYAFVEFLQDISKWLIIGLLVAAFVAVLIPDDFFLHSYTFPFLSMLLVLLASVPMYVCATASVPIAAVLMLKGLSPGAVFVFLMAGPATNAATITVLIKTIGKATTAIYLGTIIIGALVTGMIINYLPSNWWIVDDHLHAHSHGEILPQEVGIVSSIILAGLIINALFQKYKPKSLTTMNEEIKENHSHFKIKVEGMECNHCKKSVETNLIKLDTIEEVTADLVSQTVLIKGEKVDLEKVKAMIEGLGYTYSGREKKL